jgi:hypothetical protein
MLQKRALLANVSISRWNAHKHDRKVSAQVEATYGAHDAGRYSKLLVDKTHIKPLNASASAIRALHYKLTLPWDDEGARLLPAKTLQKYTDEMRILKNQDEQLRHDFFKVYPSLVTAAQTRLGSMYDADDYPSPADIPSKFDIKISFNAIPDASDFRVDVANEAADEIRAAITTEVDAKFQAAMQSCYSRMEKVVSHISTTLKEDNPRIFDTLISNARELIECLPDLNIAGDPQLDQLREELEKMLPNTKALRVDPELRKRVADDADAILAKMGTLGKIVP